MRAESKQGKATTTAASQHNSQQANNKVYKKKQRKTKAKNETKASNKDSNAQEVADAVRLIVPHLLDAVFGVCKAPLRLLKRGTIQDDGELSGLQWETYDLCR